MKLKPEKNQAFSFTTVQVVCIVAMINHIFTSFSAVQIFEISYIQLYTVMCKKLYESSLNVQDLNVVKSAVLETKFKCNTSVVVASSNT